MSDRFYEFMELGIENLDTDNSQSNQSANSNECIADVSVTQNCGKPNLTLLDGTFFKYDSSSPNGKNILMKCVKCEPKVVKIKGCASSSSNFLSHLKRKHGDEAVLEYHEYAKQVKQKTQRSEAGNKYSQTNFEHDLLLFFINSMIPLNTVEDPFFITMLNNLGLQNQGLNVISRGTLSRRIDAEHTEQTSEIKLILEAVEYICIVVDIWSSRKRSFLGVTAHWIDAEYLSRQSKRLACRRLPGTHNYEGIAMILDEINTEFNLIPTNIVATMSNNRFNFVKAFKEFGVSLQALELINLQEDSSDEEEEEDEVIDSHDFSLSSYLGCAAHTLNLCATIDANRILKKDNGASLSAMHHSTIEKCNTLWKAAGCAKTAEIIEGVLGHTLSKPDVKSWNSLYEAMKQIYSIKGKNIELYRALCLNNYISSQEFEYINEYITCSRPIAEALDILQGETPMYYGLLIPCLMALRKKLKKLENTQLKYCHDLAAAYSQSVERRFEEFYKLFTPKAQHAIIASLSYPRFKNKWFTCITPNEQKRIDTLFKHEIAREVFINTEDTENRVAADAENSFFEFEPEPGSEVDIQSPKTKADIIASQYFAEEDRTFKVLDRYSEVKSIFRKYNTPLPSSASVERFFSDATMINLTKSSKLSDNMFEQRVVMRTNINSVEK